MRKRSKRGDCKWWGEVAIPLNCYREWRLGPLGLRIAHLPDEWQVVHGQDPDPFLSQVSVSKSARWKGEKPPVPGGQRSFPVDGEGEHICLFPALPDRSIVARPETPVQLSAGETTEVYVTSPLWLRIVLADTDRILLDVPTFSPKEAWLGPGNTQGLLCYGSRAPARLSIEDVPWNPVRVVCKIHIANHTHEEVQLPRVFLPTGLLKLFVDREHRFWTQELTLQLGDELTPILGKGAPPEAVDAQEVSECRSPSQPQGLPTALEGMLG